MADITITQKITIELDGKSPFEYVVMKQGDKGSRILAVSLLQNKQPYEIPTGCTARIKYYKPDGNPVLNDCTLSGNEILVTYTEQMLAAAGVGKGEIVLLKGGKELKSATYYTKIVETVYKTDGFVSDKEFLSMGTIFNDMDQAAQAATANAKVRGNCRRKCKSGGQQRKQRSERGQQCSRKSQRRSADSNGRSRKSYISSKRGQQCSVYSNTGSGRGNVSGRQRKQCSISGNTSGGNSKYKSDSSRRSSRKSRISSHKSHRSSRRSDNGGRECE